MNKLKDEALGKTVSPAEFLLLTLNYLTFRDRKVKGTWELNIRKFRNVA